MTLGYKKWIQTNLINWLDNSLLDVGMKNIQLELSNVNGWFESTIIMSFVNLGLVNNNALVIILPFEGPCRGPSFAMYLNLT